MYTWNLKKNTKLIETENKLVNVRVKVIRARMKVTKNCKLPVIRLVNSGDVTYS